MSGEKRLRTLEELLNISPSEETNTQEDSSGGNYRERRGETNEDSFADRLREQARRGRERQERIAREMEENDRREGEAQARREIEIREREVQRIREREAQARREIEEEDRIEREIKSRRRENSLDELLNLPEEEIILPRTEYEEGEVDEDEDYSEDMEYLEETKIELEREKERERQKTKKQIPKTELKSKANLKHPVFDLTENSPVFFIKGKVYAVEDRIDYSGDHFNGAPLVQVGDLRELDELYLERADSELEEFKEIYIRDIKKRYIELQNQEGLDLPQYLYLKIFPSLIGENYKKNILDNLNIENSEELEEKEKIKINRKELEKLVLSVERKIHEEKERLIAEGRDYPLKNLKKGKIENLLGIGEETPEEEKEEEGILLNKIAGNENMALIDGGCYPLSKKGKAYALKLIVEGNVFYLDPKNSKADPLDFEEVGELEDKFEEELERILKIEALDEKLTKANIEEELSMQDADLIMMKDKNSYEKENFSFRKLKDGGYELNEALSPFIVKAYDNYYIFDKPVVSIKIYNTNDGKYTPMTSLYLKNRGYERGLCMGGNQLPKAKTNEELIVKYLKKARDMVTGGFAPDWLNDSLPRCTRAEAERLDIPILDIKQGGKKI